MRPSARSLAFQTAEASGLHSQRSAQRLLADMHMPKTMRALTCVVLCLSMLAAMAYARSEETNANKDLLGPGMKTHVSVHNGIVTGGGGCMAAPKGAYIVLGCTLAIGGIVVGGLI